MFFLAHAPPFLYSLSLHFAPWQFGGRASHGYTAFNSNNDGNGHGTHCASTAAGTAYGVAKNANVIGVKVLSDFGSGSTNGVIAGVNWVIEQSSSRTKVGNLSLGGGASTAMDSAVNSVSYLHLAP